MGLAPPLDKPRPGAQLPPLAQAPTLTGSMVSARPPAHRTPPPQPPQPPQQPQPQPQQPQQQPQLQPQQLLQRVRLTPDLLPASLVCFPSHTAAPPSQAVPSGFTGGRTRASSGAAPRLTRPAPT